METAIVAVSSIFAVLSAIGVLLTRENLYAALYMSITMLFIASIYAMYNIQQAVILIAFVFVGAIGIITIAIAATYRQIPSRRINLAWMIPIFIVFVATSYEYYRSTSNLEFEFALENFTSNYMVLMVFLFSLIIIMMISAIRLARRVEL